MGNETMAAAGFLLGGAAMYFVKEPLDNLLRQWGLLPAPAPAAVIRAPAPMVVPTMHPYRTFGNGNGLIFVD